MLHFLKQNLFLPQQLLGALQKVLLLTLDRPPDRDIAEARRIVVLGLSS